MAQGGGQGRYRSRAVASKLENQVEVPSGEARAQDQKQPMFLVQSEARKGPMSQLQWEHSDRTSFPPLEEGQHFCPGRIFNRLGGAHPH